MSNENLPSWASREARGEEDYFTVGAALLTRDGRMCGNATVCAVATSGNGERVVRVVTDAGNETTLLEGEVVSLFWPPMYIVKGYVNIAMLRTVIGAVLLRASAQFTFYEVQHRAKGAAGAEKAEVNREWAELCNDYGKMCLGREPKEIFEERFTIGGAHGGTIGIEDRKKSGPEAAFYAVIVYSDEALARRVCNLLNAEEMLRDKGR